MARMIRFAYLGVCFLLICSVCACSRPTKEASDPTTIQQKLPPMSSDHLPELSLSSASGKIQTVQSTYCWGRLGCADYIGGRQMMEGHDPSPVSAGEDIEVRYLIDPAPSEMYVYPIGEKHDEIQPLPLEKGVFKAPKEPGIYYYTVSAWWKTEDGKYSKGDTSAAFAVQVR